MGNISPAGSNTLRSTTVGGVRVRQAVVDDVAILSGEANNDSLSVYEDELSVFGKGGDDTILGNADGLCIFVEDGNDRIVINGDKAEVYGAGGNDYIEVNGDRAEVYSESGSDQLFGGSGNNNRLYGEEGNDQLFGGSGNETLDGGSGHDKIFGNDGNDRINSSGGFSRSFETTDNDEIWGGRGNDTISGSEGNDKLYGNEGNDLISASSGNHDLRGGTGNDTLVSESGNSTLRGTYDRVSGMGEKDILVGSWDKDIFYLGDENVWYASGGEADYVSIIGFSRSDGDKFKIAGSASDYEIRKSDRVIYINDVFPGTISNNHDRNQVEPSVNGDNNLPVRQATPTIGVIDYYNPGYEIFYKNDLVAVVVDVWWGDDPISTTDFF